MNQCFLGGFHRFHIGLKNQNLAQPGTSGAESLSYRGDAKFYAKILSNTTILYELRKLY